MNTASTRVVLKENPRRPLKPAEAPTASASPTQVAKNEPRPPLKLEGAPPPSTSPTQPMADVMMERDESPARVVLRYRDDSAPNMQLKERGASLRACSRSPVAPRTTPNQNSGPRSTCRLMLWAVRAWTTSSVLQVVRRQGRRQNALSPRLHVIRGIDE